MTDKDSSLQDGLLQLVTSQNETIAKLLAKQNEMIEKQNETMQKMREEHSTFNARLMDIVTAVKTLEKNSNLDHDDNPFPTHELDTHEPAWRAVYETLTAKIKDQVERWRNGMDSTLIFVALFVTVITAFQTPVSQNLTPNPADLTNAILNNLTAIVYEVASSNGFKVPSQLPQPIPFRPARTDQIVTLFWVSSLLLSLLTAILSSLGRQWVEHLTTKPDGQTFKAKSWRLDFREKLAAKLLRPILDWLQLILILSVILFIIGLLYQLWDVSFFAGKPPILILTSLLGSSLILGLAAVILVTLLHGVRREESPFTTSSSLSIRRQFLPDNCLISVEKPGSFYPLFCTTVKQMGETHHFDQISSVTLVHLLKSPDIFEVELAVSTIVSVLGSDATLKVKETVIWNIFTHWWSIEDDLREKSIKCVKCYWYLCDALQSAESDTPSNREKTRLLFHIARSIVFLKFSGVNIYLSSLESSNLKRVYVNIFILDPKDCIDKEVLRDTKKEAWLRCLELEREEPHLFDDIIDCYMDLLPAVVRKDVSEYWKLFILPHLRVKDVTGILDLISTKSLRKDADYQHLITILFFVLHYCKLPFALPLKFDLSNFIKFMISDDRRFEKITFSWLQDCSPSDVILSYLSLMDEKLLAREQHLSNFLDSLEELDPERPCIRDGIRPADIALLRLRAAPMTKPLR